MAVAARVLLKDYVNGKICFCNIRPDHDPAKHGEAPDQVPQLKQFLEMQEIPE